MAALHGIQHHVILCLRAGIVTTQMLVPSVDLLMVVPSVGIAGNCTTSVAIDLSESLTQGWIVDFSCL